MSITKVQVQDYTNSGIFAENKNITSVDLSHTDFINNSMKMAFFNCANLTNVSNVSNTTTDMGGAFYNCTNLTNAPTIPNSVNKILGEKNIQYYGWYNASYQSGKYYWATLTNTPTTSDTPYQVYSRNDIYSYGKIKTVGSDEGGNYIIPSKASSYKFYRNEEKDIIQTITYGLFQNCKSLVNAPEISNSVNNMNLTFSGCSNLVNAPVIPNSVTSMYRTFQNCNNLRNAPALPNSVSNIDYSFYNCFNLVNAPEIPNSVINMSGTFGWCNNLINAPEIPNSVINMAGTFQYCNNLVNAPAIPNSVTTMAQTFTSCVNLVNAPVIGNSVNKMSHTFASCSSLINAPVLPNSVTNMYQTFYDCDNLVSAPIIPNSVIDMYATFSNCLNLSGDVYIESGIINSASDSFNNSTLTKNVYIPFGNSISYNTFNSIYNSHNNGVYLKENPNFTWDVNNVLYYHNVSKEIVGYNTSITNLIFPSKIDDVETSLPTLNLFVNSPITSIDFNCTKLQSNVTEAFNSNSNIVSVYNFPRNTTTNMYRTFYNCINLVNVQDIPDSVLDVQYTFYNCGNLVNAPVIGNSVYDMYFTFYNCVNLTTAPTIPNSVAYMQKTFDKCSNLSGNIYVHSNRMESVTGCFNNTTLTKNVYIPFTFNPEFSFPLYCYRNDIENTVCYVKEDFKNTLVYFTSPIYDADGNVNTSFLRARYPGFGETITVYKNPSGSVVLTEDKVNDTTAVIPAGTNSWTYNAFISAGYDTAGTTNGVYLKDINA